MIEKLRNLIFLFTLEIISIDTTLSSNFGRGVCKARKNPWVRVTGPGGQATAQGPYPRRSRWCLFFLQVCSSAGLPSHSGAGPALALHPGLPLGMDRARCPCGQSARHLAFANGGLPPHPWLCRLRLIVLVLRLMALNFLVRADITNQAAVGDAKWTDSRGQGQRQPSW